MEHVIDISPIFDLGQWLSGLPLYGGIDGCSVDRTGGMRRMSRRCQAYRSCSPVIAPSVRQAFAPCATAGSRDGLWLSLSKLTLRIVLLLWVLFSDSQASQMQAQEGGDASRPASENWHTSSSKDRGSSPPLSSTGNTCRPSVFGR